MHVLEKKMIELGVIDTTIESIHIDDWFENATIAFSGKDDIGEVTCDFKQCFEISLKHDRTYSKGKNADGSMDYKYFIQDVEIVEDGEFYIFRISAWPLVGEIICKKICVSTDH
ncbi:hypothetical protein [Clostridium sp. UBA6640]|uniref:hypothetical protein n=1 Tax=Clostridium sp. UBA6640 TaxID=1946370 RepID=UPI0025C62A9E|nr:hypothetical protein [Clostridium sp. UBA6640]